MNIERELWDRLSLFQKIQELVFCGAVDFFSVMPDYPFSTVAFIKIADGEVVRVPFYSEHVVYDAINSIAEKSIFA